MRANLEVLHLLSFIVGELGMTGQQEPIHHEKYIHFQDMQKTVTEMPNCRNTHTHPYLGTDGELSQLIVATSTRSIMAAGGGMDCQKK
jgi:hypothetical protein